MSITIHHTFLPHSDPDQSVAFYRDALGFEVLNDVGYEGMRWVTVAPLGNPAPSIVLYPLGADPGITEDETRTISEMMAKGTFASLVLSSDDLEATFDRAVTSGAEVAQEPTDQDWGARDCALRDPAGNMVRIQQR